jgi:hypothetical protein
MVYPALKFSEEKQTFTKVKEITWTFSRWNGVYSFVSGKVLFFKKITKSTPTAVKELVKKYV